MKQILYLVKQLHQHTGKILYLNLIGMILISLFEGIGLLLIIPLIGMTGMMTIGQGENSQAGYFSNLFNPIPGEIGILIILGIYVLLLVGQSFFQHKQIILNAKIQQSFLRHLREKTYKSIMLANWEFFLKNRKTDISNSMTTELARVSSMISLFLQFLAAFVFTLIQIGFAIWFSAKITGFVLLFGFILLFFSRKFIKKASALGGKTTKLSQSYLSGITDHINGIKDIKSNTLENQHISWFHNLCKRMENNVIEIIRLRTVSQLRYKVASSVLLAVFVYFSIQLFQSQPAQLMLIVLIFARLWPRFAGIQSNLETMSSMLPSLHSLLDLQNDSDSAREINNGEHFQNAGRLQIKKEMTCQDVYFRYKKDSSIYALKNINVTIPANKMTAVVGPSGAGKSTLIDILMGLNKPDKGRVMVDGTLLSEDNLLALRSAISYVPQDPFLFNATIRENLSLVDEEATEEQLWEALKFSSAADFVNKLPLGLDTMIGDRGIRLSGGERQRLVLARAILRKPSILVLDEATSALDTENEKKIQEALEELKGKMTIIVIAHRLSTIRHADQVLVLDQGEIVQTGGFNQLAKEKKSMFHHLLNNQLEVN
ncbi:ABC transporter ATP-binding protein [Metabacillus arenae]|uniref:ABC transporter ATP-binding protein n=1 Tax=Metabacillus arenae TaxID=2771434 RepID=A0A926N8V6_9BACI|nr:ABC transporter ATP-binding protein [Metabacillus arenae]MBD1378839.1 ABC transporter ATP-binding protein [Metabacillus arenae]